MDFSNFRNYYFIRCFQEYEYRKQFNCGTKIYINSMDYFHSLENKFQQDKEGIILEQKAGSKGYCLLSKNCKSLDKAIEKIIYGDAGNDDLVIQTKDFKVSINGYILCMTIIPKSYFSISDKNIIFNENMNFVKQFFDLLNQYSEDKGYSYVSIYDAEKFMNIFYSEMINRGYTIDYGMIAYESLTPKRRLELSSNKNYRKIVFTKSKIYSYQQEFRFFISGKSDKKQDHIEEYGINIYPSLLNDFTYLSPDYIKKIKRKIQP